MHPGQAEQPRARPDRRLHLLRLQHPAARRELANGHAASVQPQPRQDVRGKVAAHHQHLVAGLPWKTIGDQMQPVGRAVGEDDVLRRSVDQPADRLLEASVRPRSARSSSPKGQPSRRSPPRPRARDIRQRCLVRAVQPHPAIEGAEVNLRVVYRRRGPHHSTLPRFRGSQDITLPGNDARSAELVALRRWRPNLTTVRTERKGRDAGRSGRDYRQSTGLDPRRAGGGVGRVRGNGQSVHRSCVPRGAGILGIGLRENGMAAASPGAFRRRRLCWRRCRCT